MDIKPRAVTYAVIAATADGGNTIIADPDPGQDVRIWVWNMTLRVIGAGNSTLLTLDNNGASAGLTLIGAASPGIVYQFGANGMDLAALRMHLGEAFQAFNDAGVDVVGHMAYSVLRDRGR